MLLLLLLLQDSGDGLAYIFANEGDIYGSGSSASSAYSYTTVIDVHTQQARQLSSSVPQILGLVGSSGEELAMGWTASLSNQKPWPAPEATL